ncbi:16803_t:CDS:2 [Cetraspora pellucida]|uniref:16803_t:CDS:1 n=1 Tax=Cetraspora pellucida TaxID=1433469 RepID=A0A9N9BJE1_9GLOM|nr:16803_t:CDS:2 [Cetraspora pellucida]
MQAAFTVKHRSKSIPSKANKFKIQTQKKLGLFRTTFYQVLCNHNPDIIASDNDFVEYLAEQVWDLDILSLILVDNSESESAKSDKSDKAIKPLSEKEVVEKIYDVVKDDFLTFEVCQNEQEHMPLTFHHLIPRVMHKRVVKKGLFTKEECLTRGTNICRPCHSACHKMISHEKMAYEYNTVDKLLEHEGVIKFVTWVSKQKEYSKDHAIRKLRYSK